MTREEAIEWMQEEKASFERAPDLNGCPMTEYWQKAIDVYDMAISALRQQDVTDTNVGKMAEADRIRSMTDEELAELLNQWGTSTRAWQKNKRETMEWLQKPAEEADHDERKENENA